MESKIFSIAGINTNYCSSHSSYSIIAVVTTLSFIIPLAAYLWLMHIVFSWSFWIVGGGIAHPTQVHHYRFPRIRECRALSHIRHILCQSSPLCSSSCGWGNNLFTIHGRVYHRQLLHIRAHIAFQSKNSSSPCNRSASVPPLVLVGDYHGFPLARLTHYLPHP